MLYSRQLRDAINQDDYAAFAKRCSRESQRPEGLTLKVEGVRMARDTIAIVRVVLFGMKKSHTIVYEDGAWLQEPADELAANFGRPVEQWVC